MMMHEQCSFVIRGAAEVEKLPFSCRFYQRKFICLKKSSGFQELYLRDIRYVV